MKLKLYLFALTVTLISLSSCFRVATPITNEQETINALNTEWRAVDGDTKLETILFTGKSYLLCIRKPNGDLQTVNGNWQYTGVGKGELLDSPFPISIQLVNDLKLVVNNKDIYKCKKPANSHYSFKIHL
jgi:hypothetical protein